MHLTIAALLLAALPMPDIKKPEVRKSERHGEAWIMQRSDSEECFGRRIEQTIYWSPKQKLVMRDVRTQEIDDGEFFEVAIDLETIDEDEYLEANPDVWLNDGSGPTV